MPSLLHALHMYFSLMMFSAKEESASIRLRFGIKIEESIR